MEWINAENKKPGQSPHGLCRNVLLLRSDSTMVVGFWDGDDWSVYHRCCHYNGHIDNVTHWMPLPEPPEEESEK